MSRIKVGDVVTYWRPEDGHMTYMGRSGFVVVEVYKHEDEFWAELGVPPYIHLYNMNVPLRHLTRE